MHTHVPLAQAPLTPLQRGEQGRDTPAPAAASTRNQPAIKRGSSVGNHLVISCRLRPRRRRWRRPWRSRRPPSPACRGTARARCTGRAGGSRGSRWGWSTLTPTIQGGTRRPMGRRRGRCRSRRSGTCGEPILGSESGHRLRQAHIRKWVGAGGVAPAASPY